MIEVTPENTDGCRTHISLVMERELAGEFFPILQQGFGVTARVPCSIRDLLCDQFGLTLSYVTERITTIFLDGKATDSVEEAIVGDQSTIALSAAMPGVVGATMRRRSYYAAMRSAITCKSMEKTGESKEGKVWVKLFNLLLDELGTSFLEKGIIVPYQKLADFFLNKSVYFWEGCNGAQIDGKPVAPTSLNRHDLLPRGKEIEFSIVFTINYEQS